ncbi:hypothetical protein [Algoriphagus sp. CAU 1675]|uniref:hypothetical protein n=1 Tax=Algoriphagus sp. CAU 1675 TaxID=3032597 RepID=UPI0023DBC755|nr:hypothetical protein [Algoriphagus sp. CAU 1675]MDF2157343.1 hypothetical protein [Algoriphagus sp. CAU 1675]
MKLAAVGLLTFLSIHVLAQQPEKALSVTPKVNFRTFWMSTSYAEDFKDDYSLGASINLGASFQYKQNWSFEFGYRYISNVWSSDIWGIDPLSGRNNRYERGLYDLLNPKDRFFGKLETLHLDYKSGKLELSVGRMPINSDWINGQDGRLAPTAVEGLKAKIQADSNWKITGWYIDRLNVRGTSEWLNPGETIGIFPVARDPEGRPSGYYGNTRSERLTVLEVDRKLNKGNLHFSHTLAHNIFNTYWLRWDANWPGSDPQSAWITGLIAGYQHGIGNGGNSNPELRYKDPNDQNWSFSARFGYKKSGWLAHLNFTKAGGKGRWLNPREWGKDAWYTFVPRERNEGYENFEALVAYAEYTFPEINLTVYNHWGFHWLPFVGDVAGNKYAFPSYKQVNVGVKYQPKKYKNLDFHFLVMNKEALRNEALTPAQRYNKIEMIHVNGIINWRLN